MLVSPRSATSTSNDEIEEGWGDFVEQESLDQVGARFEATEREEYTKMSNKRFEIQAIYECCILYLHI